MHLLIKQEQLKFKTAGLEFDGGTAAICRRALATGRNAFWMKQ